MLGAGWPLAVEVWLLKCNYYWLADRSIGLFLIGWLSGSVGHSLIGWLSEAWILVWSPWMEQVLKSLWCLVFTMAAEQLVFFCKKRGTFNSQVKGPKCWIYPYIHNMRSTIFTKFQACNAVLLTISTMFSKFLGHFLILDDWNFIPIEQQLPISLSPRSLATTLLPCASMSLITLDTAYKWNHAVFVLQWLAYFS